MTKETFNKARIYGLDQQMFGIFKTLLMDVLLVSLQLYFGYIAYLWQVSINAAKYCNLDTESEIVISGMFMVVSSVINFAKDMPFKVYKTFVLEEKHGFNKQTTKFFIIDQLKGLAVLQVLMIPITAALCCPKRQRTLLYLALDLYRRRIVGAAHNLSNFHCTIV